MQLEHSISKIGNLPSRKKVLLKNPPPAGHYSFVYTPSFAGSTWTTSFAFNTNSSSTHTFIIDNITMCPINAGPQVLSYNADMLMHTDYYPFGQQMPARTWQGTSEGYRYSHNSHEKEDAIYKGAQSAEYWMYDSRIGRRWERDPIVKYWESPYASFSNNPIIFADPRGLDSKDKREAQSGARDGAGTKYSNADNNRANGNSKETFNTECNCYVGDNIMASAEENPVTATATPKTVPTYGSGGNNERPIPHVAFTVASYNAGAGAFGVGGEVAIKEFNIDQDGMAKNFLYPSDKPIYIWEADGKGGAHGVGVSANFGDGYMTEFDPWEPIDEQISNIQDYDIGGQYGFLSVSHTEEVSLNPSRIQYTMMGVGFGWGIKGIESPISAGGGTNGITNSIREKYTPTFRDSMRTAAAYPNTAKGKAFNSRLEANKTKILLR